MKALYIFVVTLKIFAYIAIVILNFYFGWLVLSSVFGVITSKANAYEVLGHTVVNLFIYNIVAGMSIALISALAEYLESKIEKSH